MLRKRLTCLFTFMVILGTTATAPAFPVLHSVEDFSSGSSNWYNAFNSGPASWNSTGGAAPTGNGHLRGAFNFMNSTAGTQTDPLLFRAEDQNNASGHRFEGNYISAGVQTISMAVRHDGPTPMNFFARVTGPANFPGAVMLNFQPVAPNTWTQIAFPVSLSNPFIVYEGGPSNFNSVFGNVGHVQVGVLVSAAVAGVNAEYTFGLDRVVLTPEPAAGAMLLCGSILLIARRKGRGL